MRHFLQACLDSVYAAIQDIDAEVIVVDNASSDDSCTMVKEYFPQVNLIANAENIGFSKANNQGVACAKGTYLCILNPDTIVGEDTFTQVLEWMMKNPTEKTGLVGVRLIDGRGNFLPESKRNLPTPSVAFNKLFGNGKHYYARDLSPQATGKIDVLVGAFMMVQRDIYKTVNGFDERYFMYGEDIDLSYTVQRAGYHNYYLGNIAIVHFKGESTAKDLQYRKRFYGAMRLFYTKYFKQNIVQRAFVYLSLQVASVLVPAKKPVIVKEQKKNYILISGDATLAQKLTKALGREVKMQTMITDLKPDHHEIIVDATVSYKTYIKLLQDYKAKDCTFKIIPKNSTFALGSDSSEFRGEIVHF